MPPAKKETTETAADATDVETATTDDGFIEPTAVAPEVDPATRKVPTKVEMLGQLTGKRNGMYWPKPGSVVTVPKHEADQLIKVGVAKLAE